MEISDGEYEVVSNEKRGFPFVWFLPLFQVALIFFKLCGVVEWSWWVVTSPLWFTAVVEAVVLIVMSVAGLT